MRYVTLDESHWVLFFLTLVLSGCNYYIDKRDASTIAGPTQGLEGEETPTPALEPITFAKLKKEIFVPHCFECHSGAKAKGSLDLSTYDGLMKSSSAVIPGDAEESMLYFYVKEELMPEPPREPLSKAHRDMIFHWIEDGANEN